MSEEEEISRDAEQSRIVVGAIVCKVSLADWPRILETLKRLGAAVIHQRVEPEGSWLWIEKDSPSRREARP